VTAADSLAYFTSRLKTRLFDVILIAKPVHHDPSASEVTTVTLHELDYYIIIRNSGNVSRI